MDAAGALPPTTSTTTTATANSSTAREPAAATAARDAAVGGGAESSADENTGIARREIGAPPSRGYGTTTAAAEVRNGVGVGLGSRGSTSAASAGDGQLFKARKRKAAGKKGAVESSSSGRGGGGGAAPRGGDDGQQQQEEEEGEEGESWWKRVLDKYGSIELENKGSVARDHLALGEYLFLFSLLSSLFSFHSHRGRVWDVLISLHSDGRSPLRTCSYANKSLITLRTNIPRLATDIPLLRLHRHSHHAAVPAQHIHLLLSRLVQRRLHPSPPCRQTSWRDLPWHLHPRPVHWLPQVL